MTDKEASKQLKSLKWFVALSDGIKESRKPMIMDALDMGADALDRWVLVTERKPEDDRLVIVCTESGQVYTDYYFDDKPDFWRLAKIIAWQDLPSAYKKEDK